VSRRRELTLLSLLDSARIARRFPRTAANLISDLLLARPATPYPRRIGLFLTDRCDFACPMCAVRDVRDEGLARGGDMPFEVVERVFAESSPHQPAVDLIGGEPLLYPRLADAIRIARDKKILAVVTTNGLKLEDHAEALVDAGLPMLQVSLDGWDDASQAARGRVKGSFERLCRGVRAVQKARGSRPFPVIRILTAITRVNYANLDKIHEVVAGLGVRSWGVSNYFYLNRDAHQRHTAFALIHGLSGAVAAHPIAADVYLSPDEVRDLKLSLARVRKLNRKSRVRIAYAWHIDLDGYYSTRQASSSCRCDLPYTRLDIHTDGHMAVCVSGKRVGQVGRESIADVWRGRRVADYRAMYERNRPLPMCFRCCGLSQSISFDRR
jgi:MoaA/NifB/PqqE/SkfB family radical SAM enzyme